MKSSLRKNSFLKVLEIGLMFFVALFFMANSTQAQTSNNFNFPYNYGDFFNNYGNLFTNSNSWFSFPSFDYQNNYRYGQSNFGGWSQSNIPSFSPLLATPNYFPSNQNQALYGLNFAPSTRTSSNNQPSFVDNFLGYSFSSISFDPGTQTYNVPWIPYKTSFPAGAWIGTADTPWDVFLYQDGPVAYYNGTIQTNEGTSQAATITIEDDGDTFTFKPGEIFRIVLPMYDNISNVDFPRLAGWYEEGYEGCYGQDCEAQINAAVYNVNIYGFEPNTISLIKDDGELIQENTYRGLWASQKAKNLVFNYYRDGSDEIVDTFSVTIKIQGSGHYTPSSINL